MERIKYRILEETPILDDCKKYYYFYKIINKTNNKFYYGVHSTKILNDGYYGSSKRLKKDVKQIGIENFEKQIIKFFKTESEMYEYENTVVNKQMVLNKNCYNMHTGGSGSWDFTLGRVCVKDASGNTMMVEVDDEDYIKGNLVSNMKGLVHVKTNDGENKTITQDEYYKNKHKYSPLIGTNVLAKGKDGKIKWVEKEEFSKEKQLGNLVGSTKHKGVYKDKNGAPVMCEIDDERVLSGELVGFTKGDGVYKYKNDFSKLVVTTKDDIRVINGELVGINFGIVHCINPSTMETFSVRKDDERIKTGEIITWSKYLRQTGRITGNGKQLLDIEYYKEKYPQVIECIERGEKWKKISEKTGLSKKKIDYLRSRYKILKNRELK